MEIGCKVAQLKSRRRLVTEEPVVDLSVSIEKRIERTRDAEGTDIQIRLVVDADRRIRRKQEAQDTPP